MFKRPNPNSAAQRAIAGFIASQKAAQAGITVPAVSENVLSAFGKPPKMREASPPKLPITKPQTPEDPNDRAMSSVAYGVGGLAAGVGLGILAGGAALPLGVAGAGLGLLYENMRDWYRNKDAPRPTVIPKEYLDNPALTPRGGLGVGRGQVFREGGPFTKPDGTNPQITSWVGNQPVFEGAKEGASFFENLGAKARAAAWTTQYEREQRIDPSPGSLSKEFVSDFVGNLSLAALTLPERIGGVVSRTAALEVPFYSKAYAFMLGQNPEWLPNPKEGRGLLSEVLTTFEPEAQFLESMYGFARGVTGDPRLNPPANQKALLYALQKNETPDAKISEEIARYITTGRWPVELVEEPDTIDYIKSHLSYHVKERQATFSKLPLGEQMLAYFVVPTAIQNFGPTRNSKLRLSGSLFQDIADYNQKANVTKELARQGKLNFTNVLTDQLNYPSDASDAIKDASWIFQDTALNSFRKMLVTEGGKLGQLFDLDQISKSKAAVEIGLGSILEQFFYKSDSGNFGQMVQMLEDVHDYGKGGWKTGVTATAKQKQSLKVFEDLGLLDNPATKVMQELTGVREGTILNELNSTSGLIGREILHNMMLGPSKLVDNTGKPITTLSTAMAQFNKTKLTGWITDYRGEDVKKADKAIAELLEWAVNATLGKSLGIADIKALQTPTKWRQWQSWYSKMWHIGPVPGVAIRNVLSDTAKLWLQDGAILAQDNTDILKNFGPTMMDKRNVTREGMRRVKTRGVELDIDESPTGKDYLLQSGAMLMESTEKYFRDKITGHAFQNVFKQMRQAGGLGNDVSDLQGFPQELIDQLQKSISTIVNPEQLLRAKQLWLTKSDNWQLHPEYTKAVLDLTADGVDEALAARYANKVIETNGDPTQLLRWLEQEYSRLGNVRYYAPKGDFIDFSDFQPPPLVDVSEEGIPLAYSAVDRALLEVALRPQSVEAQAITADFLNRGVTQEWIDTSAQTVIQVTEKYRKNIQKLGDMNVSHREMALGFPSNVSNVEVDPVRQERYSKATSEFLGKKEAARLGWESITEQNRIANTTINLREIRWKGLGDSPDESFADYLIRLFEQNKWLRDSSQHANLTQVNADGINHVGELVLRLLSQESSLSGQKTSQAVNDLQVLFNVKVSAGEYTEIDWETIKQLKDAIWDSRLEYINNVGEQHFAITTRLLGNDMFRPAVIARPKAVAGVIDDARKVTGYTPHELITPVFSAKDPAKVEFAALAYGELLEEIMSSNFDASQLTDDFLVRLRRFPKSPDLDTDDAVQLGKNFAIPRGDVDAIVQNTAYTLGKAKGKNKQPPHLRNIAELVQGFLAHPKRYKGPPVTPRPKAPAVGTSWTVKSFADALQANTVPKTAEAEQWRINNKDAIEIELKLRLAKAQGKPAAATAAAQPTVGVTPTAKPVVDPTTLNITAPPVEFASTKFLKIINPVTSDSRIWKVVNWSGDSVVVSSLPRAAEAIQTLVFTPGNTVKFEQLNADDISMLVRSKHRSIQSWYFDAIGTPEAQRIAISEAATAEFNLAKTQKLAADKLAARETATNEITTLFREQIELQAQVEGKNSRAPGVRKARERLLAIETAVTARLKPFGDNEKLRIQQRARTAAEAPPELIPPSVAPTTSELSPVVDAVPTAKAVVASPPSVSQVEPVLRTPREALIEALLKTNKTISKELIASTPETRSQVYTDLADARKTKDILELTIDIKELTDQTTRLTFKKRDRLGNLRNKLAKYSQEDIDAALSLLNKEEPKVVPVLRTGPSPTEAILARYSGEDISAALSTSETPAAKVVPVVSKNVAVGQEVLANLPAVPVKSRAPIHQDSTLEEWYIYVSTLERKTGGDSSLLVPLGFTKNSELKPWNAFTPDQQKTIETYWAKNIRSPLRLETLPTKSQALSDAMAVKPKVKRVTKAVVVAPVAPVATKTDISIFHEAPLDYKISNVNVWKAGETDVVKMSAHGPAFIERYIKEWLAVLSRLQISGLTVDDIKTVWTLIGDFDLKQFKQRTGLTIGEMIDQSKAQVQKYLELDDAIRAIQAQIDVAEKSQKVSLGAKKRKLISDLKLLLEQSKYWEVGGLQIGKNPSVTTGNTKTTRIALDIDKLVNAKTEPELDKLIKKFQGDVFQVTSEQLQDAGQNAYSRTMGKHYKLETDLDAIGEELRSGTNKAYLQRPMSRIVFFRTAEADPEFAEGIGQAIASVQTTAGPIAELTPRMLTIAERKDLTIAKSQNVISELTKAIAYAQTNPVMQTMKPDTQQYQEPIMKFFTKAQAELGKTRTLAEKLARTNADNLIYNYSSKFNFDHIMDSVFGYPLWYLRTFSDYPRQLLMDPNYLAKLFLWNRQLNKVNEGEDLPFWMRASIRVEPFDWIKSLMGTDTIYLPFLAQISPLESLLNGDYTNAVRQKSFIGRVYNTLYGWGPGPHALVPLAIGTAQYAIGDLLNDDAMLEEASQYFGYLGSQTRLIPTMTALAENMGFKTNPFISGGTSIDSLLLGLGAAGALSAPHVKAWYSLALMAGAGVTFLVTHKKTPDGYTFVGPVYDQKRVANVLGAYSQEPNKVVKGILITPELLEDVAILNSDPYLYGNMPEYANAYTVWTAALTESRAQRALPQIFSYFGGPGVSARGTQEILQQKMYSHVDTLYDMRDDPSITKEEYSQAWLEFSIQYPVFPVYSMFKRYGNEAFNVYAYSVLSRVGRGASAKAVYNTVGLDYDIVDQFFKNKGRLVFGTDAATWQNGIRKLGLLLQMPDAPTARELGTAGILFHQLQREMEVMYPGTSAKQDAYFNLDLKLRPQFLNEHLDLKARMETELALSVKDERYKHAMAPYYVTIKDAEDFLKQSFMQKQNPVQAEAYMIYLQNSGDWAAKKEKQFLADFQLFELNRDYNKMLANLDNAVAALMGDISLPKLPMVREDAPDIEARKAVFNAITELSQKNLTGKQKQLAILGMTGRNPSAASRLVGKTGTIPTAQQGVTSDGMEANLTGDLLANWEVLYSQKAAPTTNYVNELEDQLKFQTLIPLLESVNNDPEAFQRILNAPLLTAKWPTFGDPLKWEENLVNYVKMLGGENLRSSMMLEASRGVPFDPQQMVWAKVIGTVKSLSQAELQAYVVKHPELRDLVQIKSEAAEHVGPTINSLMDIVGANISIQEDGTISVSGQTVKKPKPAKPAGRLDGGDIEDYISKWSKKYFGNNIEELYDQYIMVGVAQGTSAAQAFWRKHPQLAQYQKFSEMMWKRYKDTKKGGVDNLYEPLKEFKQAKSLMSTRQQQARGDSFSEAYSVLSLMLRRQGSVKTPLPEFRNNSNGPSDGSVYANIIAVIKTKNPQLGIAFEEFMQANSSKRQALLQANPDLARYITQFTPEQLGQIETSYNRGLEIGGQSRSLGGGVRVYKQRSGRTGL